MFILESKTQLEKAIAKAQKGEADCPNDCLWRVCCQRFKRQFLHGQNGKDRQRKKNFLRLQKAVNAV